MSNWAMPTCIHVSLLYVTWLKSTSGPLKKGLKTLCDMINIFSAFNLIAARQYNLLLRLWETKGFLQALFL